MEIRPHSTRCRKVDRYMPLNMARGAFVRVFPLVLSLTAGLWGCGGGPKHGPEAKRPIIPPAAVAQNQMVAASPLAAAGPGSFGTAVRRSTRPSRRRWRWPWSNHSRRDRRRRVSVSHASKNGDIDAYDGRATAPLPAAKTSFSIKPASCSLARRQYRRSRGRGSGPVAMLRQAHRDHGKLPWDRLFKPASIWPRRLSRRRPPTRHDRGGSKSRTFRKAALLSDGTGSPKAAPSSRTSTSPIPWRRSPSMDRRPSTGGRSRRPSPRP